MSKKTFWILSWTWGIIMTIIGCIAFMVLKALGYKTERNIYGYIVRVGQGWGGAGMGPFCICAVDSQDDILNHEFGHGIQNCYFGPFQIFISITSGIRYQYRGYLVCKKGKKYSDLRPYDDAWYEGMATRIGEKYSNKV